ncbi:uncharacterized protein LOC116342644 [Contarinia nasturtii]|uniref:uncharacterized protein LOC116342644 n=1 Tax=Contarinia nasturtii TaxID=265458 RepID=UPI0012D409BA|nr:uncharacterized protein LOC116342644 [Contarinia nasturtii]
MNEKCLNCGLVHNTDDCDFPSLIRRCPRCLVTSVNGENHTTPCYPTHTVAQFRTNVYGLTPTRMFSIRFQDIDWVYHWDKNTGSFEHVTDDFMLLSPATEGIFRSGSSSTSRAIHYDAVSAKRFSVLIAVFDGSRWRFRIRVLCSPTDGVICFPLAKTFYNQGRQLILPDEYKMNTALVIGINAAKVNDISMNFRVNCITLNQESTSLPGGQSQYFGCVHYSKAKDCATVDEILRPSRNIQRRFKAELYAENGPIVFKKSMQQNQADFVQPQGSSVNDNVQPGPSGINARPMRDTVVKVDDNVQTLANAKIDRDVVVKVGDNVQTLANAKIDRDVGAEGGNGGSSNLDQKCEEVEPKSKAEGGETSIEEILGAILEAAILN